MTDSLLPSSGARIDIGGRALLARVMGRGSPPIVCEAGLGDTSQSWSALQNRLAPLTTVCSYDRAGLGGSDSAPVPRTVWDMAEDLALLLNKLPLAPPYILVAHSFGAQVARLYASQHPQMVAGMLLLDPSHEEKEARFEMVLQGELLQRHRAAWHDPARNTEQVDRRRSAEALRQAACPFAFPLVVLTRGRPLPRVPLCLPPGGSHAGSSSTPRAPVAHCCPGPDRKGVAAYLAC